MPKFFVEKSQVKENKVELIGEDVKHILQVLRAKIGEELTIGNIDEKENYLTQIEQIQQNSILCNIVKRFPYLEESKVDVTIFQGLPKADKMEYIIQKNTELGVKQIVPVIMQRCVAKLEGKDINKKIERWQKIALSAAKQSRRDTISQIESPITIQQLCDKIKEFDLVLLAYEEEQKHTMKQELKKAEMQKAKKIAMIIGPEGGIEKEEIQRLEEAGAKKITLGKRILRTETASIMIMSNIIYEYEL